MTDEIAEYLASGSVERPEGADRLDRVRRLLGDEATWSEAPHEVEERVLDSIITESRAMARPTNFTSGRRSMMTVAVIGAAAVVALALGLLGVFERPDETVVAMQGTDLEATATGVATLRPNDSGWWIRLDVDGLPAAAAGTYYEGWVWSDDGEGVSVGTFHLRGGGSPVTLWSGVDPADYPSLWVTLEDEDGDPSASDRVVMRGRIATDS